MLPQLASLDLGGGASHDFVLTPSDYTVRIPGSGGAPDVCECGLFAFDAGEGLLPLWILGDPFIRTYFTVFDRDRKTRTRIFARREVILSSGTANTARLLQMSGIGPAWLLGELGVPVIADLPVGETGRTLAGDEPLSVISPP